MRNVEERTKNERSGKGQKKEAVNWKKQKEWNMIVSIDVKREMSEWSIEAKDNNSIIDKLNYKNQAIRCSCKSKWVIVVTMRWEKREEKMEMERDDAAKTSKNEEE